MSTPAPQTKKSPNGKNLRDLRERRNALTAEIKTARSELEAMKAAGKGGPQRQALRKRLVELRSERETLGSEAKKAKAAK